jgi:cyclic beta-1,2-glucan synthetase
MYRAGVEGLLGIRREGAFFSIDPRIPPAWPGFEATVNVDDTRYVIKVVSRSGRCGGVVEARLDGGWLPVREGSVRVPLDGAQHLLHLVL